MATQRGRLEPLAVLLPATHPLADLPVVPVAALAGLGALAIAAYAAVRMARQRRGLQTAVDQPAAPEAQDT